MFLRKQVLGKMLMKVIAIALTIAMILPSSLSNVAAAAAKTPKLSITKTTNMYVGKKLTISVKNKVSGSKYAWDSSNKKVATVDSKGRVTGVKAGNTTITCTVTASSKVYNLKANVNVVKGANSLSITNKATGKELVIGDSFKLKTATKPAKVTDKVTWTTADSSVVKVNKNGKLTAVKPGKAKVTAKTASGKKASVNVKVVDTITVATQKELAVALAKKGLSQITLETNTSETFTISSGTYANTQLIVNAPNADVINNGVFKNIRVDAIKASTWTERAKGNSFDFRAPQGRLVVSAGSEVNNITLSGAKVDIVVEGSVKGNVTVAANAKTEVNLSGSPTVEVKVVVNGIGAKIVTAIKVSITLNVNAELTFDKGSEGSRVEKANNTINESIINNTDDKNIEDVKVVKEETPTTTSTTGSTTTPSSGGGVTPTPPPAAVFVTGITLSATTKNLMEGESFTLTSTIAPSTSTNKNVTWQSSNEEVATITGGGVVTAVSVGVTTISAIAVGSNPANSVKAICVVTVNDAGSIVPITSITLNTSSSSIYVGETVTITATVNNDATEELEWEIVKVTGDNIVEMTSVTSGGAISVEVEGLKAGEVIIRAKSSIGNITKDCTVTVSENQTKIVVSHQNFKGKNCEITQDNNFATILQKHGHGSTYMTFTLTVPEGKTLSEYSTVSFTFAGVSGDYTWKRARLLATMTNGIIGDSDLTDAETGGQLRTTGDTIDPLGTLQITDNIQTKGDTSDQVITLTLDNDKTNNLTGTVYCSIFLYAGADAKYKISDITFNQ